MLRRALLLAVAVISCVLLRGAGARAAIDDVVVDDPAISGPAQDVQHVVGDGYEDDPDSTTAEGEGGTEVDAASRSASLDSGTYDVSIWVPQSHGQTFAKYAISYQGGTEEVRVNQSGVARGAWLLLGNYPFDGATTVRSTDASGTGGKQIAWDAVRWQRRATPPPSSDPDAAVQLVDDPTIGGPLTYVNRFAGIGWEGDLLRTVAEGDGQTEVNSASPLDNDYVIPAFAVKDGKRAGRTGTHPSWECPNCGRNGPWNGNICMSCGRMDPGPDY